MKHVVIAGGGFAGIRLARSLRKEPGVRVTLVNSSADFRYSPALYRAATGFKLGTARIPLEWMLLDTNTEVVIATITGLDAAARQLILSDGQHIGYDYLVCALGSVTSYFDIAGLHEHAYGVKTVEEVLALKRHIHTELVDKAAKQQNFVVVGAGPTGVELSGTLGAYLRHIQRKHRIRKSHLTVYLVEAGPRILPQMSVRASLLAERHLRRMGVRVLTGTMVKAESIKSLRTSTGTIQTDNVIWTAGTANNPFFAQYSAVFPLDKRGRVVVDKHLQVSPEIYVCGDNAATPYSGLALTAVSHANFIAQDIRARIHQHSRPSEFETRPPQVVPAGDNWSVMQYGSIVLYGRLVSLVRRVADFVGYTDVLGPLKAFTIWSNSKRTEELCATCRR